MPSAGAERPAQTIGRRERNAEARVQSLALSPDGKTVAAISHESLLIAWSTEAPGEIWRVPLRGGGIGTQHVAFAPNGELVLALGGRLDRRKIFEERGRVVWAFGGESEALFHVASGVAGVLASPEHLVRVNVETGAHEPIAIDRAGLLRSRKGATRLSPMRVSVSETARMAHVLFHVRAAEGEQPAGDSLRLVPVDLEARRAREAIALSVSHVNAWFSSLDDGRAVLLSASGPPRVIGPEGERALEDAGRRSQQLNTGIATPDGGFLAAGRFGGTLWDLETGRIRAENRAMVSTCPRVALAGGLVAVAQINAVSLFSAETLTRRGGAAAHGGDVREVAVSPRGRAVYSSDGSTVRAWHAQTSEPMWETDGSLLAVSPDGSRVAVHVREDPRRGRVALLDAATGDRTGDGETAWVEAAVVREDGVLLSALRTEMTPGSPGTITFCEDVELREVGRTQVPLVQDRGVCLFSADGRSFLQSSQSRTQTHCFDVPSGALRWETRGGYPVISPDGAFVALTSGGSMGIRLFEMATGAERGQVTLESWRVVAWGKGDLLLAVSPNKDPRVIRLQRRELESFANLDPTWLELEGGRAASTGGAFFPDGTRVAVGEEDGTLRVWRVDGF